MDAPEGVAETCDLVCILASDGRVHPALFRAVTQCNKPVFMDKPFAVSLDDAHQIFMQAAKTGTRIFGSSAFRYADSLMKALNSMRAEGERVKTCCVR